MNYCELFLILQWESHYYAATCIIQQLDSGPDTQEKLCWRSDIYVVLEILAYIKDRFMNN